MCSKNEYIQFCVMSESQDLHLSDLDNTNRINKKKKKKRFKKTFSWIWFDQCYTSWEEIFFSYAAILRYYWNIYEWLSMFDKYKTKQQREQNKIYTIRKLSNYEIILLYLARDSVKKKLTTRSL